MVYTWFTTGLHLVYTGRSPAPQVLTEAPDGSQEAVRDMEELRCGAGAVEISVNQV